MMFPVLRSFMRGRKLLIVRKVAVRLPSIDARHSSSLVCSIGPGVVKLPPALAMRMSSGPNSRSIRRRMASISLNLVTSAVTSMASPPACTMSVSTADSASTSLPCSATFAPSRANRAAIAAPMPRELPVTRAILSFKRSILVARSQRHWRE